MTDSQVVTIDYLLKIINQKNINIKSLAIKAGIEYTNLNSILNKKRVIGDKTIIKLSEVLGISYNDLKNPPKDFDVKLDGNTTGNYVEERGNTYQADTLKLPDFGGENPQSVFLEKLKYLGQLGEMRKEGLLSEDEFLRIKSRLINLL